MSKFFPSLLLACSMLLVSCDKSAETPAPEAPTAQQAQQLRDNNLALLKNIELLKGQIEARKAARVAGRTAVEIPQAPTMDFSMIKTQVRTALEASGACKPWIDFVVKLFDLLGEMLEEDTSKWTDAEFEKWEAKLMNLFAKALSCLEPLFAEVQVGEGDPDIGTVMSQLQSFDKCMCGAEGGSIFGSSAALVYGTYGVPSTGTGYQGPSAPGGDTYTAPGSPAGDGYGAPKLFE